jgi:hypothetical protein
MKKKFKYDGKSRPATDLYKKEFDRIFGKKIKKDEEVTGYYYNGYEDKGIEVLTEKKIDDPFKKEVKVKKTGKISKKEMKEIEDRNGF